MHNVGIILAPLEMSRAGVGTDKVAFLGESLSDVAADATSGTRNKYGFLCHTLFIGSALQCVTPLLFSVDFANAVVVAVVSAGAVVGVSAVVVAVDDFRGTRPPISASESSTTSYKFSLTLLVKR